MKTTYIPTLFILFVLTSCSSLKPKDFSSNVPVLDLVKFFSGHTHSAGVMEDRNGKPSEGILTKTTGVYTNGVLSVEQELYFGKEKKSHRSFKMSAIDPHHLESTGSDIATKASGELYGNYFTWSYRSKIADKGLIQNVNMTQYMTLMPDGTLIVRSVIRKFGIIVIQITEQFHKDD
jgi:hypothetical protein